MNQNSSQLRHPKEKLVFWDHSYHSLTLSNRFMLNMIQNEYDVVHVMDESWRNGASPSLEKIQKIGSSVIVFWQAIASPKVIKKITGSKIFVPMYDDVLVMSDAFWIPYLFTDVKILCFCRAIYRLVRRLGFQAKHIRYFPPPDGNLYKNSETQGLRVFLWPRRNEVHWDMIKVLLGDAPVDKLFFRIFPDPDFEMAASNGRAEKILKLPSPDDVRKYHIHFLDGWLEKQEYLNILSECNVFFGPRRAEGIGVSLLEAMAQGMCVVAPDLPVMNEYIVNGYNGLLYELRNPRPLDFGNVSSLCRNALTTVEQGHQIWERERCDTLKFIKSGSSPMNIFRKNYYVVAKYNYLKLRQMIIDFIRGLINWKVS